MMNQKLKRILLAVMDILIGIMLLCGGANAFNRIMSIIITVYSIYLIVMGVMLMINHAPIFLSVANLVMGILLLILGWTKIAWIGCLILGIYLIAFTLASLFRLGKLHLAQVITLFIGVMLMLIALGNNFAWSFVNVFFYISGALILVQGVLDLLGL